MMGKFGNQHKTIPIYCKCPVFTFGNFKVALVGTNTENCDMKFVTATLTPKDL